MSITSYISITYLFCFLPLVMLAYSITKKEYRYLVLLVASLLCFYFMSGNLVLYILVSTLFTYYISKLMVNIQHKEKDELALVKKEEKKGIKKAYLKKKNRIMTFHILIILSALILLKYSSFIVLNINHFTDSTLQVIHFLMPIGLSFYSLEMISYIVDLKRGRIEVCDHYLKLLLYFSYFPKLMEGPISTYGELKDQLQAGNKIELENLYYGSIRIGYGIAKKLVISDRLNYAVRLIFNYYHRYDASMMFIGAFFYTLQLYCEFSGTMDVVIGSSEIFNIQLTENFRQPFFALSISEFWQRWHISLGRFFKEYIYFPVSMSKLSKNLVGKLRKKVGNYYSVTITSGIALFAVWITNGFWHGSDWQYGLFGMYHFILIYSSTLLQPLKDQLHILLKINPASIGYKIYAMIKTGIFVCIGEMIFRSNSASDAKNMLMILFTRFHFNPQSYFSLKLDVADLMIIAITVTMIFMISYMKEKGINIKELLLKQNIIVKCIILYSLIFFILIFGAYGNNYVPLDPIYANF